jgi:hypothetical protein
MSTRSGQLQEGFGRRVLSSLLLAVAFGVAAGVFKSDETGLRGEIGNLSVPWLLVALLPALRCRTALRGAFRGLVSTLMALGAFYATLTTVLAGHLGGGGYFAEFLVEAGANRTYFVVGMMTGPLFGSAGVWIGRRHPESVWLVVGALIASEILAVALVQGRQLSPAPVYFKWGVDDWMPYIGESVFGVAIVLAALWRKHSR